MTPEPDHDDQVDETLPPSADQPLLKRKELVAAGALVGGVIVFITGSILAFGDSGTDIPGPTASPESAASGSQTAAPTPGSAGVRFSPVTADELAIEQLARLSVNLLPQGAWPTLYDDFSEEFKARCTREDFARVGEEGAAAQGTNLPLIAFKYLQDVTISGDAASGTIVAEVTGKFDYTVTVALKREQSAWKLAPAPGTEGCQAFTIPNTPAPS